MSDDEDWFERALREDTETEDGGDAGETDAEGADEIEVDADEVGADAAEVGTDAAEVGADDQRAAATEQRSVPGNSEADDGTEVRDIQSEVPGFEADADGSESDEPGAETTERGSDGVETDAIGPDGRGGDANRNGSDGREGDPDGSAADDRGESSPFDQDFASALRNAPDPDRLSVGGADVARDEADEFGGSSTRGSTSDRRGDAPSGRAADVNEFGGEDSFEDPFGLSPEDFDDAEFESDIERTEIGIEGLDDMILGGVPERSLMVAVGSAGTGKTTFGLQFLEHALAEGGTGVFVTLEETRERILDTAEEKGWSFREYEDEERLAIIDLDPVGMADSLASIRNDLPRLIDEFGADRLVLDSVSLLEMMYDHPARRRSEVFNFSRSLKDAGVTTMLTSEASGDNPYESRYGIVEYLADAVFVLQYVRPSNFQETRLAIEIQKIRDANHSRETKPYEITNDGISVYRRANIF